MKVLSIGECMAELSPSDQAGQYGLGFAGDTFNTAWYLAQIAPDIDVAYFTAIGSDAISQNMRAEVVAAGIDDSHIVTIPDRTLGLYLISLDQGERSFSYWRGQSAARHLARDRGALEAAVKDADLIYFSGITVAILPPDDRETLLSCLGAACATRKTIVFDPNLRPRLWADPSEMTDTIMRAAAVADMVLPSFEDEAEWFGDASPAETAKRYSDVGAATVIVKNGSASVFFTAPSGEGEVAVTPVDEVVDSTAAGDSFNAGVLAALLIGAPLRDSIARGCLLSGQVVQGKGALVPVSKGPLLG